MAWSPYLVVFAHGAFFPYGFFIFFFSFSRFRSQDRDVPAKGDQVSLCMCAEESTRPNSRTRRGRERADEGTVGERVDALLAEGGGRRLRPRVVVRVSMFIRWSNSEKYYRIVDRRRGGVGISLYLNFAEEGPCVHNHGVPGREF